MRGANLIGSSDLAIGRLESSLHVVLRPVLTEVVCHQEQRRHKRQREMKVKEEQEEEEGSGERSRSGKLQETLLL